jgi:WD40 repeat protein
LDEELARLGADCREPLVLCSLEGLTQDEAARRLGLSLSTVKRRLERGRERLRIRLTKRGLALSAALSACTLSPTVASAVPPSLLKSTILAAASIAAGKSAAAGIVSAHVSALTQGVIKAMFVSKLKTVTLTFLTISAIGIGTCTIALHQSAQAADDGPAAQTSPQEQKSERTQQDKPSTNSLRETREIGPTGAKDNKGAEVISLVFSADGEKLASVDAGGLAVIRDVETGNALRRFGGPGEVKELRGVLSVQFTPDGQPFAAGHKDKTVWLWRPGGEYVTDEINHPFITSLALSPDVRLLAIAGDDSLTTVDITTGRDLLQVTLAGHQTTGPETLRVPKVRKVTSAGRIIFSPDGKLIATEDAYQRTVVFDASTGKVVQILEGHKGTVQGISFSPDGKLIAIGEVKAINLWDVTSGKLVRSRPSRNDKITCIAFSPDGKILATGYADGVFRLHDVIIGTDNATIDAHKAGISSMAFSPDGKTLATGAADGTIKLWNWEGKAIRTLAQYDKKEVSFVTFTDKSTVQGGDRFDVLLGELIKAKKSNDQIIEALFLATLARLPTESERSFALKNVEKEATRRQETLSDILNSLTQTKEFHSTLEALNQRASRRPKP